MVTDEHLALFPGPHNGPDVALSDGIAALATTRLERGTGRDVQAVPDDGHEVGEVGGIELRERHHSEGGG